jgi:uncharacterized lipoprotein YmbA
MRSKFLTITIICLLILSGCISSQPNKNTLNIGDVEKAFASTGPVLIPDKGQIKKEIWLNGVQPSVTCWINGKTMKKP